MKYLLLICYDESFNPPETIAAETDAWVEEMERRGVRKAGDRLRPASDATTVRVRTTWDGAGGVGGFFERTFAPKGLRRTYDGMLERLDADLARG